MRRAAVIVPFFALLSGAIAWGVLHDAGASRLEAVLQDIEDAEWRVPYVGVRRISGAETFTLKIASAGDGRRRVDSVGARPRAFPGLVHGKERVKDYRLAVRNYEIVFLGVETVAGREAEVLEARPRHPGRPTIRVAADRVHRLALRFEVRGEERTLFKAEFTEIDFPGAVQVVERKLPAPWLKIERSPLSLAGVWVPSRLPAGFELRSTAQIHVRSELPAPLPRVSGKLAHLAYTDGLAALSVVEMPASSELWTLARRFLPKAGGAGLTGYRFKIPGGAACLVEIEGTAVLVAGNVTAEDVESTVRSLVRR